MKIAMKMKRACDTGFKIYQNPYYLLNLCPIAFSL